MYPNPHLFAPSLATLNAWLKTRKSNSESKPGIFETVKYADDAVWATIAIIIELSALVLTIYGAWDQYLVNKKLLYLIIAIITVFLFISFDFIGIMLHSQDVPEKVKLKSRIATENNPVVRAVLIRQEKEISWQTFFGMMLLVISGILKILAITFFLKGTKGIVIISVLLIFYLIVIYIHAYHTGYWWSAVLFRRRLKKEYEEWEENLLLDNNGNIIPLLPTVCNFQSNVQVQNLNIGRQKLTLLSNNNGVYQYQLESYGCFWDENFAAIKPLINNQQFMRDLVKAVLEIQMTQLQAPMTTASTNQITLTSNIVNNDGSSSQQTVDGTGN
jgi:hypothetical protein